MVSEPDANMSQFRGFDKSGWLFCERCSMMAEDQVYKQCSRCAEWQSYPVTGLHREALRHLRATAGLLLYTKREFHPVPPLAPYNHLTITRCKGAESTCQYEHHRADDGRERVVEGHSEDCPLGWLEENT